jgi:hypothetical protein
MAICIKCGKKYNRFTTPVSAKWLCSDCFFAQLEAEANTGDSRAAERTPSGGQSQSSVPTRHGNPMATERRPIFSRALFGFRQPKKQPVSKAPLICYKMAHYALPYALFQQLTPTMHRWIDGQLGYDLF